MLLPKLKPLPHKDLWRLLEDFKIIARGYSITVPLCFEFDGASIPWFGWQATYTPAHPKVIVAALVHDWIYLTHQVPRDTADKIFYEILLRCGAEQEKAWIMYQALVIGAGFAWDYCEEDKEKLRRLYKVIHRRENFSEYHFPINLINGASA